MELPQVIHRLDRRSRFYWERPRLGASLRWPVDGGELVYVPAGRFVMGGTEADVYDNEKPAHEVELSGFWLQRTPITNAQYARFRAATGHRAPDEADYGSPVWRAGAFPPDRADHPVVCVSWDDAQAYCAWAGLRLPTEAEWEYAARGPEGRTYPWGRTWNGTLLQWGEHSGTDYPGTVAVGSFPGGASWCGALDLAGNVYEWCQDYYDKDFYQRSPARSPLAQGAGDKRVVRGYYYSPNSSSGFRGTYRGNLPTAQRGHWCGFRCVLEATPSP